MLQGGASALQYNSRALCGWRWELGMADREAVRGWGKGKPKRNPRPARRTRTRPGPGVQPKIHQFTNYLPPIFTCITGPRHPVALGPATTLLALRHHINTLSDSTPGLVLYVLISDSRCSLPQAACLAPPPTWVWDSLLPRGTGGRVVAVLGEACGGATMSGAGSPRTGNIPNSGNHPAPLRLARSYSYSLRCLL